MHKVVFLFSLLFSLPVAGQVPAATPVRPDAPASTGGDLNGALLGRWVGVLEYRDFSEPAASLKRVELPTWLLIARAPEGLSLDYTYDDGPSKTVRDHSALVINVAAHTYRIVSADGVVSAFDIAGFDKLHGGHGELLLTGAGTENSKPTDVRTTWTIRRNLLSWLEETRPANSTEPFVFRHRYVFTRAEPPSQSPPTQ